MKSLIFSISLFLAGCSCCADTVYTPLEPVVTVNTRYVEVPALNIAGWRLTTEPHQFGHTFSGRVTDEKTGKTADVSGVIRTKDSTGKPIDPEIDLAVNVPKDSVKAFDTTSKQIIKETQDEGFLDGLTLRDILLFVGAIVLISFLIVLIKR